ncbi:unnamed protein product, partial [Polarella glacialis]
MDSEDVKAKLERYAEMERAGAGAYLKDALAVLLEVRPVDPLLFLLAYFRHAANPEDPAGLAWYLIKACPRSRPCFRDNLHTAYCSLQQTHGSVAAASRSADVGLEVVVCESVFKLLSSGLPTEVAQDLLSELQLSVGDKNVVQFLEFAVFVEACLLAGEALQAATRLFDACDVDGSGVVPCDQLLSRMDALRRAASRSLGEASDK